MTLTCLRSQVCAWTRATGCRGAPWQSGWWTPASMRRASVTAAAALRSVTSPSLSASVPVGASPFTAAWAAPTTGVEACP